MDPTSAAIIGGAGIAGSILGKGSAAKVDYRGAKKGIRWRVRDAKLAGVHPLFAMGAPGVGSGILSGGSPGNPQLAGAMQDMGQAVGSYINRPTKEEIEYAKFDARMNKDINRARNQAELDLAQKQLQQVDQDIAMNQLRISEMTRQAQLANQAPDTRLPDLFVPFFDNQLGTTTYMVNERAGLEPHETIGSGYWGRARALTPESYVRQP